MRWLAAVLLLLSTAVVAEERDWYAVEIIVFERIGEVPNELWPFETGLPEFANSVELYWAATGGPRAFTRLGSRELALARIYRRLQAMPDLRPLLHVGWRQPGFAHESARTVHIRSTDPERTVDGTARLHRSRYLHLLMDLRYYRPDPSSPLGEREKTIPDAEPQTLESADAWIRETPPQQIPVYFRLTESRRMRSRELHYFDHPLFGIIAQVVPYERPEAARSPGQNSAQ